MTFIKFHHHFEQLGNDLDYVSVSNLHAARALAWPIDMLLEFSNGVDLAVTKFDRILVTCQLAV